MSGFEADRPASQFDCAAAIEALADQIWRSAVEINSTDTGPDIQTRTAEINSGFQPNGPSGTADQLGAVAENDVPPGLQCKQIAGIAPTRAHVQIPSRVAIQCDVS